MTNNKEQWIDKVLASTAGMAKAAPDANLYGRVMQQLNTPVQIRTATLPLKQWAAAAILLLSANAGAIWHTIGHKPQPHNAVAALDIQPVATYNY